MDFYNVFLYSFFCAIGLPAAQLVISSIAQPSSNGRDGIRYDRITETRENEKNENYRKGDIENCNFTLVSQNERGLRTDRVKRETIFNYLKAKGDIVFLQETHSTPESEIIWKNESGCEAFFRMELVILVGLRYFFLTN